jgi:hypothetical protein
VFSLAICVKGIINPLVAIEAVGYICNRLAFIRRSLHGVNSCVSDKASGEIPSRFLRII